MKSRLPAVPYDDLDPYLSNDETRATAADIIAR